MLVDQLFQRLACDLLDLFLGRLLAAEAEQQHAGTLTNVGEGDRLVVHDGGDTFQRQTVGGLLLRARAARERKRQYSSGGDELANHQGSPNRACTLAGNYLSRPYNPCRIAQRGPAVTPDILRIFRNRRDGNTWPNQSNSLDPNWPSVFSEKRT